MHNVSAGMLHNFIFHLVAVERDGDFRTKVLRASSPNDRARSMLKIEASLRDEDKRVMGVIISVGQEICKQMELPATEIALTAFKRLSETTDIHYEDFVSQTRAVHEALWRELSRQRVYCYPPEKADALVKMGQEWSAVFKAIPAVEVDIRSGLDCWAMGHNVASIFHIMRAMEVGVQQFAKRLSVNIVRLNPGKHVRELTWDQILNEMTAPIKALAQGTVSQKRRAEKFKAAQSYLYGVKDAWRNPIMHPRPEGYSDQQTNDVINHARAFLTELAGIISPKKIAQADSLRIVPSDP
jgi:hypothetical protein